MAPTLKQSDDYVIYNLSNADAGGNGLVEVFALVGPGLPTITSDPHRSKDAALENGKKLASDAKVSLWYVDKPKAPTPGQMEDGVLVVTYRAPASKTQG
jgi:hypothetical protein